MNYRKQHLAGVTIIEVLFSTGIIVTGLLGVAGLIMIAGAQMTQGLEADAMSNAGLNAIAEFDTRKMRRPDNLLWPTSRTTFTSVLSNNLYGPGNEPSPSFCIDPFFIAQQIVDGNANTYEFNLFPGRPLAANLVQMRRVTLKNPAFPRQNLPLSLFQSREIFIAKDDLSISKPPSATELPQQTWITTSAGNYVKRLNAAETSWMATLTPNRNLNMAVNRPERTDQYLLSIVIFNNRFINYTDANAAPEKERQLNITFLNRGFGGGEVKLSHSDPTKLELKNGDWVMLSADSNIRYCFRWYRISYIEDETPRNQRNAAGEYYRYATLQGPDWSRPEWHETGTVANPIPAQFPTYVTYIPHVIGVFEKTIRIESTSLY